MPYRRWGWGPSARYPNPLAALPPFYAAGNSGLGGHYGERPISPLEQFFTRSPPPSLPRPHRMLMFPFLCSEQQPPNRSRSVSSGDSSQTEHSDDLKSVSFSARCKLASFTFAAVLRDFPLSSYARDNVKSRCDLHILSYVLL